MHIVGSGNVYGKDGIHIDRTTDLSRRSEGMTRLREDIQIKLNKAYENTKKEYHLRRRPATYQVGQQVWKRNFLLSNAEKGITSKLANRVVGPFTIRKNLGYSVYGLCNELGTSIGRWHVKDIKPYYNDENFEGNCSVEN